MSVLRQHRVALVVTVVAAAVASVLVVFALSATGYQTRHVDLNDGGIWVTSNQDGLFGRLNRPAGSLDLAINPPGGAQQSYRLDVRQQDSAVLAWDQGSGKLLPVDVVTGKAIDDQSVPVAVGEQVALAGGTLAVLDPDKHRVWATRVDTAHGITSLAGIDPSAKPVATLPAGEDTAIRGAALAVGTDGTVYAATTSGVVTVVHPKLRGGFAKPTSHRLGHALQSVQITAVGTSPVVYDAVAGLLYLPRGITAQVASAPRGVLQQPTSTGSDVVVATQTQLVSVPLSGAHPRTLFSGGGGGTPAAPTWLGDCVHAAWAGNPGVYARSCGGAAARQLPLPHSGALEDPVFRVNRDSILLNDLVLGSVYDLANMQEVDNWSAVKPPPVVRHSDKSKNNNSSIATRDQPPKAVADTLGARPERTTVLHVLDNDSDPQGAILSISRISALDTTAARVDVAPDGQAVEITLGESSPAAVHFQYTVDDGKGLSAQASVTVQVRDPGQNERPRLRHGFAQPSFSVSAGGTLDLPVLDDWRDFDGDPLVIASAAVDTHGGTVTTTPDGRLDYLAPATGGNHTITYRISDGQAGPVAQRIPVTVLGATSDKTAPPVAEPDIARGQVGKPITVKPLANDLPGADPTNPNAALALAGTVASPAGTRVDTDLKSGTVTITASRHGVFSLSYTASFGNARFAHAQIRVDVADPPASPQPPVAVPDTGVLYGQTASVSDVLANDFDPAGGVLVVQHAAADDPDQLQVAVVDGHWLQVAARTPTLSPNPQVIHYTITNGLTNPVAGELTVTQVPAPPHDTPLAVDDYATVRAGDSALIPVLDNDLDPTGATLRLLDDVPEAPRPGQLTVTGAEGPSSTAGSAFVSGKQVRYVAPAVTQPSAATISYVATNPSGERATGVVHVSIVPPPTPKNPDQAPAAQPVQARVISGDTIRITLPTTGIDPDGDTANVTGITSAPTLGRVLAIGATSITYEAFPTESGTDRFGYQVSDRYGKSSTSTISVGVGTASDPQPPVAVDDTVTAAPGTDVRVDVLANDVIAPDDSVTIEDLGKTNPDLPPGAKLVHADGPLQVRAPARNGATSVVLYKVSDGSADPSVGTVTVHSQTGYVPPPVAVDVPATPQPGATTTTVNVLAKASDPESLPLRVAKVFDARAVVSGASVRLPVLDHVQNVVFQLVNSKGGTAAAVIHVPARGTGAPYAKANKLIKVERNGSTTIAIADYVVDPLGKAVRLTTSDQLTGAPATGLKISSPDPTHLTLTGTDGYVGPAAVTFQVTDGKSLDDPAGQLALITVPVQVGPDTPVLRCPTAPISVVEGGDPRALDITALCHVWLGDRSQLDQLRYTASWDKQPGGVDIVSSGAHVIGVQAGGAARPGDTGQLRIRVAGTDATPATLNVAVQKLGKASIAPISVAGVKAGTTVVRDIRGFVSSPLRDPHVVLIGATKTAGMAARVSWSGSTIRITPGANTHGRMQFSLLVTDVADTSRTDRRITGTLTLEVLNVPDAPGAPQAGRTVLSQTVVLSWPTPADNGAQIDSYQVQWPGGAQTCPASPCRIVGLVNGHPYAFTVRAHNAVGYSKPSRQLAPPAIPDKLPAAVARLTAGNPQDHTLTLSWTPVANGSSAIRNYRISWSGGGAKTVPPSARSAVVGGLDNHNVYTFTVVAVNHLGAGPPASARGQSAGAPGTPSGVGVSYADAAGTTTRTVRVSWHAVDPNGAGPATYTVTRNGTPICTKTTASSCTDTPATGHTYTYAVTAYNGAGHRSSAGSAKFAVAGTPDTIANISAKHTATDGQLKVSYTSPNSHGKGSRIECTASPGGSCGSWAGGAAGTAATQTISGLAPDTDVTITLRDCNSQYCGAKKSAQAAHTDGPPHAPSVSCSRSGDTITWSWTQPKAINGYTVHFKLSGAHSAASTTANSWSKKYPEDGASHTLTVTSIDSRGESGGSDSHACTDHPKPNPPTVTVVPGTWTNTVAGCTNVGCHAVDVTLAHFKPGQQVTFYRTWLPSTDNGAPGGYKTVTVDSNGHWHGIDGYYGGGNAGGNGTGTVSIYVTNGGPSDSCHSDWHIQSDYRCD